MGVIPVVFLMIGIFFWLTRNEIISLSKEKLALQSANCAEAVDEWAGQVINEMNIYKKIVEDAGLNKEEKISLLKSSYGINDAYPYGIYGGDEKGNYFDASGWDPGDDYVVKERNWYLEGIAHEKFAFGEPYEDEMTGNVCVTVSAKLDGMKNESVLAADVYLDYASDLVDGFTEKNINNAFFVTENNKILVAGSNAEVFEKELEEGRDGVLPEDIARLIDDSSSVQAEVELEDGVYYVNINKIESMNWYFISLIRRHEVLQNLYRVQGIMLVVATFACGILIFTISRVAKSMNIIGTKAETDPLTKLMNRESFQEMVQVALREHPNQGMLLIIDMDNFKQINDTFGHPTGDLVLKCFAEMLEEYFNRKRDYVARIGGDEFAVFVGRTIHEDEGTIMLEKFVELVRENFKKKYEKEKLSASVGAAYVRANVSYTKLYESVDAALYEVKKGGKDGFIIR